MNDNIALSDKEKNLTVIKQTSFISTNEPNNSLNHTFRTIRKRSPWTNEEDKIMKTLINKHGTTNWTLIANKLGNNRTGKQCRERWFNQLNPNMKKLDWSFEEEKILFNNQMILGNKWAEIANLLPGRTLNDIKNHFYSRLRKFIRDILKQINNENLFKINGIDNSKYTGDKIYKMIKKHEINLNDLTKDTIFKLIIATEKNPKGKFIFVNDNNSTYNNNSNFEEGLGVQNNFNEFDQYTEKNFEKNLLNINKDKDNNKNNLKNRNQINIIDKYSLNKTENIQNITDNCPNLNKKKSNDLINKKRKKITPKKDITDKNNNNNSLEIKPIKKTKKVKKSKKGKKKVLFRNEYCDKENEDEIFKTQKLKSKIGSKDGSLCFFRPIKLSSPKTTKNINYPSSGSKSNKSIKNEEFSFNKFNTLNDYLDGSQTQNFFPGNLENLVLFHNKNKNIPLSDLNSENNFIKSKGSYLGSLKNDNTFKNLSISGNNLINKIIMQNNNCLNNNITIKSLDNIDEKNDIISLSKKLDRPSINMELVNNQDFSNIIGNENQFNYFIKKSNYNGYNSSPTSIKIPKGFVNDF